MEQVMKTVKRYRFYSDDTTNCRCEIAENIDGKWVEWDEYKILLDKCDALVAHILDRPDVSPSYEPSSGTGGAGGGSPNRWPGQYGMGRGG